MIVCKNIKSDQSVYRMQNEILFFRFVLPDIQLFVELLVILFFFFFLSFFCKLDFSVCLFVILGTMAQEAQNM